MGASKQTSHGDDEALYRSRMNQMEDRTLARALDSYGRDCGFVRSKLLPVFGCERKRSADQIRGRWNQLIRKSKPLEML
ncbi:MAG: hypothetical protein SGARI_000995 [Bacillariaceae sp.]